MKDRILTVDLCQRCGGEAESNAPTPKTLALKNIDYTRLCLSCYLTHKQEVKDRKPHRRAKAAIEILSEAGLKHILETGSRRLYIENLTRLESSACHCSQRIASLQRRVKKTEERRARLVLAIEMACALAEADDSLSYLKARAEADKTIRDPALRQAVFARDFFLCRHCGSKENLTVDHVVPVSLGGGSKIGNLQTLCLSCNSKKGATMPGGRS